MASDIIQEMHRFDLGKLEEDVICLLIGFTTTEARAEAGILDTFAVGMTRKLAVELGTALLKAATDGTEKYQKPEFH